MITPGDVVDHLGRYLPRVSNLFNDTISATGATVGEGNVVTVNTPTAHGLGIGSPVSVRAASVTQPITGWADGVFAVGVDHDLTEPQLVNDLSTVTLSGFTGGSYNGDFTITRVPNRLSFSVNIPGDADPPVLTGSERLTVNRSVSVFGIHTVDSVPTATSFTFSAGAAVPGMATLTLSGLEIVTAVRVAAVADIDRAEELYTRFGTDRLWAFVVMMDVDVSKDRHSINDAFATFSRQDEMRLRILQNFAIIVFIPTASALGGSNAQQLAYGDVFNDLLRVMYGFTGFATDTDGSTFATVSTGHGRGIYRKAYYTQVYDWQTPVDITVDNGWQFMTSVAFRDITGTLPPFTPDNEERFTLAINLDDEV